MVEMKTKTKNYKKKKNIKIKNNINNVDQSHNKLWINQKGECA